MAPEALMIDSYRDDHWSVLPGSKGIQGQMPEPGCEQACSYYPVQRPSSEPTGQRVPLSSMSEPPAKALRKGDRSVDPWGRFGRAWKGGLRAVKVATGMVSFQVEPWLSVVGAGVPGDSHLTSFCCTPCLTCQVHGLQGSRAWNHPVQVPHLTTGRLQSSADCDRFNCRVVGTSHLALGTSSCLPAAGPAPSLCYTGCWVHTHL